MADLEGRKELKEFHLDVPARNEAFFLKGSNALDWGMKNRLARIFSPQSGRTVMLAIDHGYFQGPTTGLERIDVTIPPLLPYSDTLMLTRGALRSTIPPTLHQGHRAARERRPEHPQGALQRADRASTSRTPSASTWRRWRCRSSSAASSKASRSTT